MKLFYTLVLVFMVLTASGQRAEPFAKPVKNPRVRILNQQTKQNELDTLSPGNELNATGYVRLYYSEEEGLVFGPNIYGDDAYAQRFVVQEPYTIHQAIFWIFKTAGETGQVVFTIWDYDPQTGPADVLATDTIALADLSGGELFGQAPVVSFDPPVVVTGDYVIGVDFSDLDDYSYSGTGATFSLDYGLVQVSTAENQGGQLGHAWVRNQTDGWLNALVDLGFDVDIAIYPLVSDESTSGHEPSAHQGQYHYYPNPAVDHLQVTGSRLIEQVRILDLTGNQVFHQRVNDYRVNLALNDLHPGIYILQIIGDLKTSSHKVQVIK